MTLLIDGIFTPLRCVHHWLLARVEDEPGPEITATCQRCGASRKYPKNPEMDHRHVTAICCDACGGWNAIPIETELEDE